MIRAIKGDITKIDDVQAIVNAANRSLRGGGGVDGAIHRAAGPQLLEECLTLNGCHTGEAKITRGYKLPCEYVIHTVGPRWLGGEQGEADSLKSCYQSSLEVAVDNQIKRIAFPSISTGVYGYPINEAAEVAVKTVKEYVDANPEKLELIEWVSFDDRTFEVYKTAIDRYFSSNM